MNRSEIVKQIERAYNNLDIFNPQSWQLETIERLEYQLYKLDNDIKYGDME